MLFGVGATRGLCARLTARVAALDGFPPLREFSFFPDAGSVAWLFAGLDVFFPAVADFPLAAARGSVAARLLPHQSRQLSNTAARYEVLRFSIPSRSNQWLTAGDPNAFLPAIAHIFDSNAASGFGGNHSPQRTTSDTSASLPGRPVGGRFRTPHCP